ncbi:MAG: xanthine dehydrogenase molybdopterin binding subunit [Pseudomonadota bacterium]
MLERTPKDAAAIDGREGLHTLRHVRKPMRHDSATKHVTGTALYIDDIPEPAGTVHLALGLSPVARGYLKDIDLAAVKAAPGVLAVLTATDVPGINDASPIMGDDPVLCDGPIAFHGQVLFAVVGETRLEARHAATLAKPEIEAEVPVLSPRDALKTNRTILPDYAFRKGDAEAALGASASVMSGTLDIGGQEHFYLEGQAALAVPGEDHDMVVHSSTQHPSEVQHNVAKLLGVPDNAVTVEVRRMGGAFGGKESQAAQWAQLAALAARVTGRPAKIRLDRDDDMIVTGKRHDFAVDYRLGHESDGLLTAYDVRFASRCGYSADLSAAINDRTMFHADNAYYLPAAHILSKRMKTDTVSNTAFRGFGGPQGMLAIEAAIERVALTTGLDALDVRKRNLYSPGRDVTPYGMTIEDNILPELIAELEDSSDYRGRRAAIEAFNKANPYLKRGLSLTPVKFGISFTTTHLNQAGALVHAYTDGSVYLNHGGTEMGQGLFVKVAQVVADVFGLDLDRVKITSTNTTKVPNTAPTAASSGADMNGMAAKIAAEAIRDRLAAFAADEFEVDPSEIRFRDNHVFSENHSIAFGDLCKKAWLARISLSSTGFYKTPKVAWDRDKAQGRPFYYYAYGAAVSEVLVDTITGEMKVQRVDILHDCGRSLNPAIDIGQIEGGFVQGMGWLTTEELVWNADGRLLTHAPSTYKIPVASDVPADFRVALHDGTNREETVFRSKAVGEPPLMLANSVFCAVYDAVAATAKPGVIPTLHAPATPEAILNAIDTGQAP